MTVCAGCGAEVSGVFCRKCGVRAHGESNGPKPDSAAAGDSPRKTPVKPERKVAPQPAAPTEKPVPAKSVRQRIAWPWVAGGATLLFVIVFLGGLFLLSGSNGDDSPVENVKAVTATTVVVADTSSGTSPPPSEVGSGTLEADLTRAEASLEDSNAKIEDLENRLLSSNELLTEAEAAEIDLASELQEARSQILELQTGSARSPGATLATVRNRGYLKCGVSGTTLGFSETRADGATVGFDADYCRAVAAATLGDSSAVKFVPLTASERFPALSSNEVDLLIRTTTWTQSRDTDMGLQFGPTMFFDGQQLMGDPTRLPGLSADSDFSASDGAVVCTFPDSTVQRNLIDSAASANVDITFELVDTIPEAMEMFVAGDCDIVATGSARLHAERATARADAIPGASRWVIFPKQRISREPLGPVVREGDENWLDIVQWTVFSTVIAEARGVSSNNVDSVGPGDGEMSRLFGGEDESQTPMGLRKDAFYQVIKQVGNYGEIFSRNLATPLEMERIGTPNELWSRGGLIFAPPAR